MVKLAKRPTSRFDDRIEHGVTTQEIQMTILHNTVVCLLFSVLFQILNSMSDQVFLYLPLSVLEKDCTLRNGIRFPKITFGVSHIEGYENVYNAVDVALGTGYRSFDCSPLLRGEENLGNALEELLPKHNLQRKDVIISSKILPKDYGLESTSEAFWHSCENLKTDYIDLFLMQWPGGHNLCPEDEGNSYLREETWKEIVGLSSQKLIRSPGVCHFTSQHLESIRKCSNAVPVLNQVEFHPKFPQLELVKYCEENNIKLQTAGFRDTFHPLLLNEEMVIKVASNVKRSPTQVLLKWIINKGVTVVIESEIKKKIQQNFQLFDFVLEYPDMIAIDSINTREKYLRNPICVV